LDNLNHMSLVIMLTEDNLQLRIIKEEQKILYMGEGIKLLILLQKLRLQMLGTIKFEK
jgi:hypothetical protein